MDALRRMAVFADPTGAVISVWQPGTHPGSGWVNEPNTLLWPVCIEAQTWPEAAANASQRASASSISFVLIEPSSQEPI